MLFLLLKKFEKGKERKGDEEDMKPVSSEPRNINLKNMFSMHIFLNRIFGFLGRKRKNIWKERKRERGTVKCTTLSFFKKLDLISKVLFTLSTSSPMSPFHDPLFSRNPLWSLNPS